MAEIKLYDLAGADPDLRFSPICWRVKMAIAHKGLSCETIPWRFSDKPRISHSGGETVPVIEDGKEILRDSWAILEYLDKAYPEKSLLFPSQSDRLYGAFVKDWFDNTVHPAVAPVCMPDVFSVIDQNDRDYFRKSRESRFGMTLEALADARETFLEPMKKSFVPLRAMLERNEYLGGDSIHVADYIAFGTFQWIRGTSKHSLFEPSDPIASWCERMLNLFDGLGRTVPQRAS